MFTNQNNIIIFIIIFIIIILYFIIHKNSLNDSFVIVPGLVNLNDPNNDGKLLFDFLVLPNYTTNILDKYYLNDDVRIKGVRKEYHMYQPYSNGMYGHK